MTDKKQNNKKPSLGAFVEQVAKMIRTEAKESISQKQPRILKPSETSLANKIEQVAQFLRKSIKKSKKK